MPLPALALELDVFARMDVGDVEDEHGAALALLWAKAVFAAAAKHPTEPRTEKLADRPAKSEAPRAA